MPKSKLTDVSIRSLPSPENGQVTFWDINQPGFGVRVSQGGTRTFIVVYGSTRRRFTIGRFPKISLKQARDQAKKLQAGLTLGIVEKNTSPIFSDAKELFLSACRQKNRPRTVYDYDRHLKRHFAFGRTRLSEISRADIQRHLNKLNKLPSELHHAYVTAKIFFNWALREEMIKENPMATMRAPSKLAPRGRFLNAEELKEVYTTSNSYTWPFGAIIKLLVLTGQRRGEIGALRWDWIDEEAQTITLPASFTKNHQTHIFPYGDQVSELFTTLPRMGEFVFPARIKTAQHFNGWGSCKKQFDAKLLQVQPYTLHDLRRTFSSNMAMLGTPIHVTEKLLNHISGTVSGVAAIYNRHSYMDEMRSAIANYEAYLSNLINE